MIQKNEAVTRLNELGKSQTPFSFYCDFLGENWIIHSDDDLESKDWKLEINDPDLNPKAQNSKFDSISKDVLTKHPISYNSFKKSFDQVVHEIDIGNSFLTNLTFKTPIQTDLSLEEIFECTQAKYKLITPSFVVFSPETFVRIEDDKIFSFPMKGTIDGALPNAKDLILSDPKEIAEHVTIVDLIRNDLSAVSRNVKVKKFRYLDEIKTNSKDLLQVSSEVCGVLDKDWKSTIGNILSQLLPAGSISGAPKPKTIDIIQKAESHDRGFYTGICGRFDGKKLDSSVMIRFIQKEGSQLYYLSGGGITSFSDPKKEHQEMIDKIYLPIK